MSKLLAITCILIAFSAVSSQSCSGTSALRTLYGFSNTVTTATSASGIKYCKSIKNTPVCCTASEMNTFQDKSSAIVANLTTRVAARDMFLKGLQDAAPQLQTALRGFIDVMNVFPTMMAASHNGIDTSSEAYVNFTEALVAIEELAIMVVDAMSYAKSNFTNYQKARTSCVVDMLKVQNAAYCLSCDPSASSKGYDSVSGNLTMSTRVCNRLKTSCKSYIQLSGNNNDLIIAGFLTEGLDLISKTIMAAYTGDMDAINNFDKLYEEDSDDGMDQAAYEIIAPAFMPPGCENGGACDWICDGLFTGGMVDVNALANGGVGYLEDDSVDSGNGGRRMLLQAMANTDLSGRNNRALSTGDFDPDSDEAGVSVTFKDDPSTTESKPKFGSLSLGNVFVSMFVVISSVLLL